MSALADAVAALLPPEHGGPRPERVAAVARRLIAQMPATHQAGLGVALASLEALAALRTGRTLGSLDPARRVAVLASVARLGPAGVATIDAIKTMILMAAGADEFAPEIAATGTAADPSRPDGDLALVPGSELSPGQGYDTIVIGSGAGGAYAARELARAGHRVLVVEEGERWDVDRIRSTHPIERFASLYRDAGATFAIGSPPIALPLGRAVGGTTVVNSGTCFRTPPRVVRHWRVDHGLGLTDEGFEERLDEVERTLGVGPVPAAVMGRNGELALAGAEALGWSSGPLRRNAPGCRGACQCAIGCPNNAKAGVHLSVLPEACRLGATIATGLRVERIVSDGAAATGVTARSPDGGVLRLRARRVVVACGAVETPPLLRRSGIARHPRLGRGLSVHPALGATARFEEPVVAWHGVLQSAGVDELHERRGIMLEATSTPPGMGSMVTPGLGAELIERIAGGRHVATLGAMIADAPSGRVHGSRRPLVVYPLTRGDRGRLVEALGAAARVMLAAGAEQVELGGGAPTVRAEGELAAALACVDTRKLHLAAFHPTGSAAAGSDPGRHPVAANGALRGVRGVWVADGSILPSCPGVNPQVSIMALAGAVGERAAA